MLLTPPMSRSYAKLTFLNLISPFLILRANAFLASAKLYATEMLARVTDTCIQLHGGMGLMEEMPIHRLWRDSRLERIWDGTSEIQRHIISRDLLRPLGG